VNARLRRRMALGDDSGAVLLLVLIIVTVVAVLVTSLLSFTYTSVRTTVAMREQQAAAATADGATQAAVNTLRLGTYNNATGTQCFGATDTLVLPDLVPGTTGSPADSAAVRCTADPTTGANGTLVPITAANKPGNAVLTLSTNPAEDGINVKALSSAIPFNVHGGIVSNSNINVTAGALQSTTDVFAHTGCTGTVTAPVVNCGAGTAADPGYLPETTTVPAYQPVPANTAANCPGKVVTFQPGYYDDAAALSDLMSGNGACKGSVWWFKPGSYYFDFQNSSGAIPGVTGTDQWLVKDGQLVAGTPTNSAGQVMTAAQLIAASKPLTVPGACESPIRSTTAVGVQFIFGGDSRLQVSGSADAEICGSYHADRPPVAVYGLTSGTATPTTASGATATAVTGTGFTSPAPTPALSAIGGTAVTWTAGTGSTTATLSLPSFTPGQDIPAGSILSSAELRIVYGASAKATRTLTVTPSSSSGAGAPITDTSLSSNNALTPAEQTVDLEARLAPVVHSKGLSGLKVDYSTSVPGNVSGNTAVTESIDAVFLDLTYTVPTFRGQTTTAVTGNCLTAAYTGGSAGQCALLSTATAYSGRLYVQGTTYAPAAPIDITLSNITEQVLRFGVISRTLWIKETGAVSYVGPVIEIPDDSPGYGPGGTVVFLEAFVCRDSATCSITAGTRPSIRARVFIFDPTGTPVAGARQITILSWSVRR
jgi:Tfp pilus assembly protein PilX